MDDLDNAISLLTEAVDVMGEEGCWYDPHGYCQSHNLEPKVECCAERLEALISKVKENLND